MRITQKPSAFSFDRTRTGHQMGQETGQTHINNGQRTIGQYKLSARSIFLSASLFSSEKQNVSNCPQE